MKPLLDNWTGRTKVIHGAFALMDVLDGHLRGLHNSEVDRALLRAGVDPRWKGDYAVWCRSRGIAVVASRGQDAVWRLLPIDSQEYASWLHVMSEAHYSETIRAIRSTKGVTAAAAQQAAWQGSAFSLGLILGKPASLIADEMEPLKINSERIHERLVDAGYLVQ